MDILKIGRYQVEMDKNNGVRINHENKTIYNGMWHDTLEEFFNGINYLPEGEKEKELELAFDLPSL